MHQDQKTYYSGILSASPQLTTVPTSAVVTAASDAELNVFNKTKFWGAGPRAGLNTLWSFCKGWGIYGNAALSLLYGQHKLRYNNDYEPGAPLPSENNGNVRKNYRMSRAIADLAIGLEWDHQFQDDAYHLGFMLGWEQHMFFGFNKFVRFFDNQEQGSMGLDQGDLSTQGITLTGRFDF